MSEIIFVYITNPNKETAKKIAKDLLTKRLISCANLYSIDSMYWWEGKIVSEPEVVLIGKTVQENYEPIKKEVKKIHPYEIPCIIQLSVNAVNDSYKRWLLTELKKTD